MGKPQKTHKSVKHTRKAIRRIGVAAVILGLAGVFWWGFTHQADAILKLQQRSRDVTSLALAPGLAPPTSKWFSSLAFKQPSDPVFAYPLAFQTTSDGFAVSQPRVTATADTIDASFVRDIGVVVSGQSVKSYVRSYDDLSVELEVRDSMTERASIRITQGSPFIFMQLKKGTELSLSAEIVRSDGAYIQLRRGAAAYELATNDRTALSGSKITASSDTTIALYAVPADANVAALRAAAQNPITSTEVTYKTAGTNVETTFMVRTADGKPTVLGMLPGQSSQGATVGSFTTLLGTQTLREGTSFRFTTPLPDMPGTLPVEKLSDAQKNGLADMVRHDAAALRFTATDTYFAGKELYRAAQLLQLAKQLGLQSEAAALQSTLKIELVQWFDPNTGNQRHDKFFYYDASLRGVIGEKTSFGSEDFNDHHFHYGYFLHAAAIMATYDPVFAADYKGAVDILARDIASSERQDDKFPYLRVFDQYAGHSWASGFAPFGAGNNQESSSEAVNAWLGLYLWANASNNQDLRQTAQWLYAREVQSALTYYVNLDLTRTELTGYRHTIVSLLWSGKADYATFFDAAPESKLAIQLLPMNPAADYLSANKTRVSENIAQVTRETGQAPSKFKDYIIMYKAFADPQAALTEARALGDADIDGANSRSYLFAWLYTHQ